MQFYFREPKFSDDNDYIHLKSPLFVIIIAVKFLSRRRNNRYAGGGGRMVGGHTRQ